MQFPFQLSNVLSTNDQGIAVINGQAKPARNVVPRQFYTTNNTTDSIDNVIDAMGNASAKAQGLKQVITQGHKFFGTDQLLFLKIEDQVAKMIYNPYCQAMLKIGRKNLFHRDHMGQIKEIQPFCVLDFYVHENVQRTGVGKTIFDFMLDYLQAHPHQLAYDRPSTKLLMFLKKHFSLSSYIPQNNNFVVFNQFWSQKDTIRKDDQSQTQQCIPTKSQQQTIKKNETQQVIGISVEQQRNPNISQPNTLKDIKNKSQQLQEETREDIRILTAQIENLTIQQSQTKQPQKSLQTPWAVGNTNMYQTTSKMMSVQLMNSQKSK